MSMTGLAVFDRTIQTTNLWLNEIGETLGPDRQRSYHALKAVLHALRDRLPVDEAIDFAAQFPILVRGIYFDGWGPPHVKPPKGEFIADVEMGLRDMPPIDPREAARAVFSVLNRHLSPGAVRKIRQILPRDVRRMWPEADMGMEGMRRSQAQGTRARRMRWPEYDDREYRGEGRGNYGGYDRDHGRGRVS
jgi:uncharacterized protein (DUF2267 family)